MHKNITSKPKELTVSFAQSCKFFPVIVFREIEKISYHRQLPGSRWQRLIFTSRMKSDPKETEDRQYRDSNIKCRERVEERHD